MGKREIGAVLVPVLLLRRNTVAKANLKRNYLIGLLFIFNLIAF